MTFQVLGSFHLSRSRFRNGVNLSLVTQIVPFFSTLMTVVFYYWHLVCYLRFEKYYYLQKSASDTSFHKSVIVLICVMVNLGFLNFKKD